MFDPFADQPYKPNLGFFDVDSPIVLTQITLINPEEEDECFKTITLHENANRDGDTEIVRIREARQTQEQKINQLIAQTQWVKHINQQLVMPSNPHLATKRIKTPSIKMD